MDTTVLFRPVGPAELKLIEASGWKSFPPRLPDQPIFYPVTNEGDAIQIARDWNVPASGAGYVTRFEVEAEFCARYPRKIVGGREHEELWVPAEELDEFNSRIVGTIQVVREYGPGGEVPVSKLRSRVDRTGRGAAYPRWQQKMLLRLFQANLLAACAYATVSLLVCSAYRLWLPHPVGFLAPATSTVVAAAWSFHCWQLGIASKLHRKKALRLAAIPLGIAVVAGIACWVHYNKEYAKQYNATESRQAAAAQLFVQANR